MTPYRTLQITSTDARSSSCTSTLCRAAHASRSPPSNFGELPLNVVTPTGNSILKWPPLPVLTLVLVPSGLTAVIVPGFGRSEVPGKPPTHRSLPSTVPCTGLDEQLLIDIVQTTIATRTRALIGPMVAGTLSGCTASSDARSTRRRADGHNSFRQASVRQ
jgi:hypothetical protein